MCLTKELVQLKTFCLPTPECSPINRKQTQPSVTGLEYFLQLTWVVCFACFLLSCFRVCDALSLLVLPWFSSDFVCD